MFFWISPRFCKKISRLLGGRREWDRVCRERLLQKNVDDFRYILNVDVFVFIHIGVFGVEWCGVVAQHVVDDSGDIRNINLTIVVGIAQEGAALHLAVDFHSWCLGHVVVVAGETRSIAVIVVEADVVAGVLALEQDGGQQPCCLGSSIVILALALSPASSLVPVFM